MLARLKMELETDCDTFGIYQSSNLQGVLMEQIDGDYAAHLHGQGLKPYSQFVSCVDGKKVWTVNTLQEESYQYILRPLLDTAFREFCIEKKNIHVRIKKKELEMKAKEELLEQFYTGKGSRYLNLEFVTPTSFKSNGNYVIMPELRYIYQSLMNKYSAASSDMEMYDEETLEQLAENSRIIRYRLRSVSFPLEGVQVPAFAGEMTVKISGTDTVARYAGMLAEFGEFSGVGIKTAIGMGAVRIKRRETK